MIGDNWTTIARMTPLSRSNHFPELNGLSYTLRRVIDRSIVGGIRSIRSSKSGREKPLISINGSEHFFSPPSPPRKNGCQNREGKRGNECRDRREGYYLVRISEKVPKRDTKSKSTRSGRPLLSSDHIWLAPCQNEENVFSSRYPLDYELRLHSFRVINVFLPPFFASVQSC